MSKNNEHLAEFIMLANVVRDAAIVLEKAYKRAITEGAPVFEDPGNDADVRRFVTAAQTMGLMAEAAKEEQEEKRYELLGRSMSWIKDCAVSCNNEMELRSFKRYVKDNAIEWSIPDAHVEWALKLTMESIQEI